MINKIRIPWYRKNVRGNFTLADEYPNVEFPDRNKKPRPRPNKPEPNLKPAPRPEPVVIHEFRTSELPDTIQTPVPFGLPLPEKKKLPSLNPLPNVNWEDKIPKRIPNGSLSPTIKMPSGEILFKLMEAEPNGKYDKFLNDYNNLTLELMWNTANPFIVFEEPSYSQVKIFLENNDLNEIKADDIIKYFKKEGVTGKDLSTLPIRIYTFKRTIDLLSTIEDIFVPPLSNSREEI